MVKGRKVSIPLPTITVPVTPAPAPTPVAPAPAPAPAPEPVEIRLPDLISKKAKPIEQKPIETTFFGLDDNKADEKEELPDNVCPWCLKALKNRKGRISHQARCKNKP